MQCGYNASEIYLLFKKYSKKIKYIDLKSILKIIFGLIVKRKLIINGLNNGKIIEDIINKASNEKHINNINQIKMPLLITSVDLHSGKLYFFTSKEKRKDFSDAIEYINSFDIGKAVRASCSYPFIFSPLKVENTELTDGGLRENIPWKGLQQLGADKVISVVLRKELQEKCCENIIEVASRAMDIMCHELSNYELEGADYLMKIKTADINLLDIKKIDYLYNLGYETAKKEMKNLKRTVLKKNNMQ